MKIRPIFFELAYSKGLNGDYSNDVMEEFHDWFDGIFLNQKMIEYDDLNELIFEHLTPTDKKRVRAKLREYSED